MIWKKKINLNNINNSMKNTMAQYLEINIEEVGDSFIITKDGHEQITHHSKAIEDLIIN